MNWIVATEKLEQYSAMLEAAAAPVDTQRALQIAKQDITWCAQYAREMTEGVEPTGLFGDSAQRWLANFEAWAKRNEIVLCEAGNFGQPAGKWAVEVLVDRLVLTSSNDRYTIWIDDRAHKALNGKSQWVGGNENCMVFIEPKGSMVQIGVTHFKEFEPNNFFKVMWNGK